MYVSRVRRVSVYEYTKWTIFSVLFLKRDLKAKIIFKNKKRRKR